MVIVKNIFSVTINLTRHCPKPFDTGDTLFKSDDRYKRLFQHNFLTICVRKCIIDSDGSEILPT